jgi:hypothetical protein
MLVMQVNTVEDDEEDQLRTRRVRSAHVSDVHVSCAIVRHDRCRSGRLDGSDCDACVAGVCVGVCEVMIALACDLTCVLVLVRYRHQDGSGCVHRRFTGTCVIVPGHLSITTST